MDLSLGKILYAYAYENIDVDENAFQDKDIKNFIRTMKKVPYGSIAFCEYFGDISPEPISREMFIEKYNEMIFTPLVNEKTLLLQTKLTFEHDWDYLAQEFPESSSNVIRVNNIKHPKDLVLDPISFYPFFDEWDRGFRGLRDDDFIIFFAPPKCVSGSAYIPYSICLDGKIINHHGGTLRELYHSYNSIKGNSSRGKYVRRDQENYKYTTLSSNREGLLYHNKIIDVTFSGEKEVYEIKTAEGNTLRVTADHLILTNLENNLYTPVSDLCEGSLIYSKSNYYLIEDKIISKRFTGLEDTYDISMDGEDTNFLADNILVHNCGKSTITAYLAYKAIKAGIPIGFYPTELTITTTLQYILGFEYSCRGAEASIFFHENPNLFNEILDKYNHLILLPPTNRFNWNDYEALYESDAKFIFHDNFIKSASQLGINEDASSFSKLSREFSDMQHKYRKCFAKNTPVLMADGSVKMIQDVHMGDLVMGKDSTPRKVLSSYKGVDTLYQVDQLRGMTYTVNSRHDLVLKEQINSRDPHYKETILTAEELFNYQQSVTLDRKYQGISVSWDLPEANLPIDPYILGLWLGDGTLMRPDLTTQDPEIRDIWVSYGKTLGLVSREYTKKESKVTSYRLTTSMKGNGVQNSLLTTLRDLNLLNNKHIPDNYIKASRSQRLSLLAGLIDTNGHKVRGFKSRYTISTISEGLANTLEFLLNSLNLKVYRYFYKLTNDNHSDVHELCFYGDLRECPIKIDYKQCTEFSESTNPLRITKLEEGEFYGFECDGDHQFLLSDGTVVHNTTFLVTQEALREATPKELETCPFITEYGKGYTSVSRSLLQESSLALHVKGKINSQTKELIVKNDRFRGLNDVNTQAYYEITNRGKLKVSVIQDAMKKNLMRIESKILGTDNMEEVL